MMHTAESIISALGKRRSDRGTFEAHWSEIAERVLPQAGYFQGQTITPGEKKSQRVFDSTAILALPRFASACESLVVPRTQRWHGLETGIPELDRDKSVRGYLEDVTSILFKYRYQASANFAANKNQEFMYIGAFGNGITYSDYDPTFGMYYVSIPLHEFYFDVDYKGTVDMGWRAYKLTARQAAQKFGFDALPDRIKVSAQDKPGDLYEFVHHVCPNPKVDLEKKTYESFPFRSYHVAVADQKIVREGGYRTFPYAVSRYSVMNDEVYARGPASFVLPDIKMANEVSKTILRAAHMDVMPPLMATEDAVMRAFDLTPGALNFGGLDAMGNEAIKPLKMNPNMQTAQVLLENSRRVINDAFLITLFQILIDTPQMTATEATLRAQEKGALLAPTMGQLQVGVGVQIERELELMGNAGRLPPPPPVLMEAMDGDVNVRIIYTAPLNRMMRAEDAVGISQTFVALAPWAEVDDSVYDRFNKGRLADILADVNGVPVAALNTEEEMAALGEAKAAREQASMAIQAAPAAGAFAKDMSEAQVNMRNAQGVV